MGKRFLVKPSSHLMEVSASCNLAATFSFENFSSLRGLHSSILLNIVIEFDVFVIFFDIIIENDAKCD